MSVCVCVCVCLCVMLACMQCVFVSFIHLFICLHVHICMIYICMFSLFLKEVLTFSDAKYKYMWYYAYHCTMSVSVLFKTPYAALL